MNNGIHDAVNIAWKLAGVLKGIYSPSVLSTYEAERRPVAAHLIKTDKIISVLASGRIPDELKTQAGTQNPHALAAQFFEENTKLTSGLGVSYEANSLLNRSTPLLNVGAGHRAPDTTVRKPGSIIPVRLYEITKNVGRFWIVVFAGQPLRTLQGLRVFRAYLDGKDSFNRRLRSEAFEFCTIIAGSGRRGQGDETLGVEGFGSKYYDPDETAHLSYGVPEYRGAVVCLRPDGMLGFAAGLEEGGAVGKYFGSFVRPIQGDDVPWAVFLKRARGKLLPLPLNAFLF